jgi:hypothetical protein
MSVEWVKSDCYGYVIVKLLSRCFMDVVLFFWF